jgi:hypothetical protein
MNSAHRPAVTLFASLYMLHLPLAVAGTPAANARRDLGRYFRRRKPANR